MDSYVNKVFKEVDEAIEKLMRNTGNVGEVLLVNEAVKRLKMKFEASGLFGYKPILDDEKVKKVLKVKG